VWSLWIHNDSIQPECNCSPAMYKSLVYCNWQCRLMFVAAIALIQLNQQVQVLQMNKCIWKSRACDICDVGDILPCSDFNSQNSEGAFRMYVPIPQSKACDIHRSLLGKAYLYTRIYFFFLYICLFFRYGSSLQERSIDLVVLFVWICIVDAQMEPRPIQ